MYLKRFKVVSRARDAFARVDAQSFARLADGGRQGQGPVGACLNRNGALDSGCRRFVLSGRGVRTIRGKRDGRSTWPRRSASPSLAWGPVDCPARSSRRWPTVRCSSFSIFTHCSLPPHRGRPHRSVVARDPLRSRQRRHRSLGIRIRAARRPRRPESRARTVAAAAGRRCWRDSTSIPRSAP